jgi:hypothetical protein
MGPGFPRLYSPPARPCRRLTGRGGRFSSTPSRASRARHPPSPSASEVAGRRLLLHAGADLRGIARRTRPAGRCASASFRSSHPPPRRCRRTRVRLRHQGQIFSPYSCSNRIRSSPHQNCISKITDLQPHAGRCDFSDTRVRRVPLSFMWMQNVLYYVSISTCIYLVVACLLLVQSTYVHIYCS